MLNADIIVEREGLRLQLPLSAQPGEVIAVVGPNGAGKTTLLRALCGLDALSDGSVIVDDQAWEDVARTQRLRPEARSCALVLADPLLFPNLSVSKNVAFGLRARGLSAREADQLTAQWLERIDLADYGDRRPATLSTGQQQRVSAARALVVDPKLLLLDEPLSAQDPSIRSTLRVELRALLDEFEGVCIIVTHDPIDAMTLADRVIVLDEGRVVQEGSPAELMSRPANSFIAQMVGLNLLRGQGAGYTIQLDEGGQLRVADTCEGSVLAAFSPHSIVLTAVDTTGSLTDQPASSARNQWLTTVADVQPVLGRVRVRLLGSPTVVAEVTPAAASELDLRSGRQVLASLKATEIEVYAG